MLVASPAQSVPYLGRNVRPVSGIDAQRPARLVVDFESDRFADRKAAGDELEKLGELAVPALRKALETRSSGDLRRRLESLLLRAEQEQESPTAERLRSLRALEILERIGTREAHRLLADIAGGATGARLTSEAKAALERLGER